MVKEQKPISKSLKKGIPEITRNIQKKKSKVNASKEKVAVIEKTLEKVSKKNKTTEDIKSKNVDFNKKTKKQQQKEQKPLLKKQPVVEKPQQKEQKPLPKKQPVIKKNPAVESGIKKKLNVKGKKVGKTKQIKPAPIIEPTDFDEVQFKNIVSLENIKKISKALKNLVEKQVAEKKTSIFSDYKYFLNIASYKISNCPKRMVKLNVKYSLVDPKMDDIVMIVPDLQRGAKVDYEPTIQHYEDLLREHGVENIKVVPFNQLRNECTTFEAKRKFANTYDYFMCDGRIVGHVVGFCGKHFQKPRTTIHAVRLNNPKTCKSDIERALQRTSFKQLNKGDLTSIPVGNHRFTINQLAENIKLVIIQLKTLFPGGYANIRNIYIKIDIKGTSSLPLYVNLVGAPQETPNVIGPREQRMLKLKKEANDILLKFSMSKSGEFVKLNKTQVERKQQIREARSALLSKDKVEVNGDDDSENEFEPSLKKVKKDKQVQEVDNSDDEESEDSDANDEEVEEVDDEE